MTMFRLATSIAEAKEDYWDAEDCGDIEAMYDAERLLDELIEKYRTLTESN